MNNWITICNFSDLMPNTGVCALHDGEQVAIFLERSESKLYAVSNFDPIGKANVLSRGIVAEIKEQMTVASPLYKQHFNLQTGVCVEHPEVKLKTYPVRLHDGMVQLACSSALAESLQADKAIA